MMPDTTSRRTFPSLDAPECRALLLEHWILYGTNYYIRNNDATVTVIHPLAVSFSEDDDA